MKAIIVGGGVGGCTTALFLKKIGVEVSIYEKYPSPPALVIGASLGLGANGFSTLALYSEELASDIYKRGRCAPHWEMRDHDGVRLGYFPAGREGRYGKFGTSFVRRWDVHDVLLEEIEKMGIPLRYGMEVAQVEEDESKARVEFVDGIVEEADLIIGADGTKSKVREFVAPTAKVTYTGYVGVGGFLPKAKLGFDEKYFTGTQPGQKEIGAIMTYGPLGFFGFGPTDDKSAEEEGLYGWWSNYAAEELRNAVVDAVFAVKPEDVVEHLKMRHGTWHAPIPEVLEKAKDEKILVLPEYVLSGMTDYHTRRVVLVGDAAHIFQPHTGQGVSQTVEDVACLTQELRPLTSTKGISSDDLTRAFSLYQKKRKPRVDKILANGKRIGEHKHRKGAVALFFRKWFMKGFLKYLASERMLEDTLNCQFTKEAVFGNNKA